MSSHLRKEQAKNKLSNRRKRKSTNALGATFVLIMIGMSIFIVYLWNDNYQTIFQTSQKESNSLKQQTSNYRDMSKRYNGAKEDLRIVGDQLENMTSKYRDANQMLSQTKQDLLATQALLNETESFLNEAKNENTSLRKDIKELEKLRELTSMQDEKSLNQIKLNAHSLDEELADIKSQLRAIQTDVSSIAEAKALVALFHSKIRLVKTKMRLIQKETHLAKVTAQEERDRKEFLSGNNGFFIKSGKNQVLKRESGGTSVAIDVQFLP